MNLKKAQDTLDKIRDGISVSNRIDRQDVMLLLEMLKPYSGALDNRFDSIMYVLESLMRGQADVSSMRQEIVTLLNDTEETLVFRSKMRKAMMLVTAALLSCVVIFLSTI